VSERSVVSINAGSSSIKVALFEERNDGLNRAAHGGLEGIGTAPHLTLKDANGTLVAERRWDDGARMRHEALLDDLWTAMGETLRLNDVAAIGHRVVHGGDRFVAPVRVDGQVLEALDALCPLAPLHQPHNLAAIRAIARLIPHVPQIACFDTAFHHDMPEVATRLALPRVLTDRGIRRYGFHGVSYEYIAARLRQIDPVLAQGRVIAAHLGNGASLCAMKDGRSVDTTMGFTALDGLMMGTRSGALDPGVVLHLMTQEGMDAREVEDLLYHRSGLLGVSGVSSDMRALHASDDPRAGQAIELFVWRAAREIGALISSLGGIDGIVFTAGIGENDAAVRRMICDRLGWTGVILDGNANAANEVVISSRNSAVSVFVIPTDEERMIAMHSLKLCRSQP